MTEENDYNALKAKIKAVLRRYFECNDDGEANPDFDDNTTAQDVVDEIKEIVGGI